MQTKITIGATTYDATARASMGFLGIDQLKISVDEYWELEFTVLGCSSDPPFICGQPVVLQMDIGDGAGLVTRFQGNISSTPVGQQETGWSFAYHCYDLKRRADYIALIARDGSACAKYNLPEDDLDFDPTRIGKNVGQIVRDILENYVNAINLFAAGVGGFTFVGPVATLGAQTIIDLGFLTVIPQRAVRIEGESILGDLDRFIRDEYPQYGMWVDPSGVIRVATPFGFTTKSLTVPGGTSVGDPVEWPQFTVDSDNCFTQYQFVGEDLDGALLSTNPNVGNLTPANSPSDYTSWDSSQRLFPKGSTDSGSCVVTSSTSVTVTSDDPAMTWISGYWPSVRGVLFVIEPSASGRAVVARRLVTISASLSPGGSADVEWDSSQPLDYGTYSRYVLIGDVGSLFYVDALFDVCEPSTGDIGLNTFVGANLRNRDPNGIPWSNNGQFVNVFTPQAKVVWSPSADNATVAQRFPMQEFPVGVKVLRQTGQVLLEVPAVFLAALASGAFGALAHGYPTTSFMGKPYSVDVAVPYSRGPIVAQYPPVGGGFGGSGHQGSFYTTYGVQRTKVVPHSGYTSRYQTAEFQALAQQRLLTMCDVVIEGSIAHHGIPSGFDPFAPGIALDITMPSTSPIAGIPMPVRTHVIRWMNSGPDIYQCSFRFSNRKAPFSADSRYLHPEYTRDRSDDALAFLGDATDPSGFMDDFRSGTQGRAGRQAALRAENAREHGMTGPAENANVTAIKVEPPRQKLSQLRSDDNLANGGG